MLSCEVDFWSSRVNVSFCRFSSEGYLKTPLLMKLNKFLCMDAASVSIQFRQPFFFSNPFSLLVQAKLRMPMDLEGKVPVTCKLERHQFSFEDWGNKQLLCITDVPKKKTIYKLSEQGSVNYRKNLRQARFSTQQVNCTNHHTKVRKVLRTDFGVYYATFSFTSH